MAEQHLDPKQVRKAVKALLAHRQQKNTLDLDAAAFTLRVGLKKAPVDPSPKPRLIPLPHRVRNDAGDRRGCLIVKDADKPWLKALFLDGERPGAKTTIEKLDSFSGALDVTGKRQVGRAGGSTRKIFTRLSAITHYSSWRQRSLSPCWLHFSLKTN